MNVVDPVPFNTYCPVLPLLCSSRFTRVCHTRLDTPDQAGRRLVIEGEKLCDHRGDRAGRTLAGVLAPNLCEWQTELVDHASCPGYSQYIPRPKTHIYIYLGVLYVQYKVYTTLLPSVS